MIEAAASRVNAWLDRHAIIAVLIFGLLIISAIAARASTKPFWHDEIFTLIEARLPTVRALWVDSRKVDFAPPLTPLLTRAVESFAGAGEVASRVPSITAFAVASGVVFVLVRRRANVPLGLAAMAILCFTAAYRYGSEARGYGLTIGCSALALYCWTDAASGRRRFSRLPLLTLALAAAVWAHYWAVLAFLPIIAGEIARHLQRRTFDGAMWVAVAGAGALILPLVPAAVSARRNATGTTFWTQTAGAGIGEIYSFLLNALTQSWFLWLGGAVVAIALYDRVSKQPANRPSRIPAHEVIAGVTFLGLPIAGFVMGQFLGSPIIARYVLLTSIGVAVAIPILVWHLTRASNTAALLVCVVTVGFFAWTAVDALRSSQQRFTNPFEQRPILREHLSGTDPIVLTGGLAFVQLWYYTPPELRSRLTYIAEPAAASTYTGTDTIDSVLLELRHLAPVSVVSFSEFTSTRREFLVYALGSGPLLNLLQNEGAVLEERSHELGAPIYYARLR